MTDRLLTDEGIGVIPKRIIKKGHIIWDGEIHKPTRTKTLKAVGEWLEENSFERFLAYNLMDLIGQLKQGKMPE